jgi:hypothetical protein
LSEIRTLRFTARIAPAEHGMSSARVHVPRHVLPSLGLAVARAVSGTVDGEPFSSTIVPDGEGGMYLPVDQGLRARAKAQTGDVVEVVLQIP